MSRTNSEQWNACPPGQLQQVVRQVQGRKRRRHYTRAGSAVAALLLVALLLVQFSTPPAQERFLFGNFSCAECRALLSDYFADDLDQDVAQRVETHIDECPHCGAAVRRMLEKEGRRRGGEVST